MKRLLLLSFMFVTACPMQNIKRVVKPAIKFPIKTVSGALIVYTGVQIKRSIDKYAKSKKQ